MAMICSIGIGIFSALPATLFVLSLLSSCPMNSRHSRIFKSEWLGSAYISCTLSTVLRLLRSWIRCPVVLLSDAYLSAWAACLYAGCRLRLYGWRPRSSGGRSERLQ
eukprot:scaffold121411_cov35-Prasinocladus_malaysianus.AAC.1